jgi:hypothetical protein
MLNYKAKKFIGIFILLALGPIIYTTIGTYANYNVSRRICNGIGLLCLYSYYIGIFITMICKEMFFATYENNE